MSTGTEKQLVSTRGKYVQVVKNGHEMKQADWADCRVILTNERLVLAAGDTLSIPLEDIDEMGDRYDVNQDIAAEPSYSTLHVGEDVWLVSTPNHGGFETSFYKAILDGSVIFVKHQAVLGGVVQPQDWQRGRLKVTERAIYLLLEDKQKVVIERDDIGGLREIPGEEWAILEVEHTDENEQSIKTHLTGHEHLTSVLRQILEEGAERSRTAIELSQTEERVLMALYSGVSPFGISDFVGIPVGRVEEIYDRLIELDVIEVVRDRTEVELTSQGRKVAGEAMSEQ